jgi:hypothetical protein
MRATGGIAGRFMTLAAAVFLAGAALAQGPVPAPAEAPPAGFAADRYVDSSGCSFIRARIDGTDRWVPLLRADRSQACDARPSLASAAQVPAPVQAAPPPQSPPAAAAAPAGARPAATPVRSRQTAAPTRTRGAPRPADWSRGLVQVAAFAVPSNADRTEARFLRMGLPALQRPARGRGRHLQLVQIGPLDGEALRAALATARDAGFRDAYVIR